MDEHKTKKDIASSNKKIGGLVIFAVIVSAVIVITAFIAVPIISNSIIRMFQTPNAAEWETDQREGAGEEPDLNEDNQTDAPVVTVSL